MLSLAKRNHYIYIIMTFCLEELFCYQVSTLWKTFSNYAWNLSPAQTEMSAKVKSHLWVKATGKNAHVPFCFFLFPSQWWWSRWSTLGEKNHGWKGQNDSKRHLSFILRWKDGIESASGECWPLFCTEKGFEAAQKCSALIQCIHSDSILYSSVTFACSNFNNITAQICSNGLYKLKMHTESEAAKCSPCPWQLLLKAFSGL